MEEYLITIAAEQKRGLSESEEEHCIREYGKWAESLAEKHVTARRLSLEPGEMLPRKKAILTDGPFVEAKELIAGIIIIQAETIDQAREIANSCPLREYFQLFLKKVN